MSLVTIIAQVLSSYSASGISVVTALKMPLYILLAYKFHSEEGFASQLLMDLLFPLLNLPGKHSTCDPIGL